MAYPAKTTPEAIVSVALDLIEQEGTLLSMRNLAEKLGIKAPSLYRHFADKETLEGAMVQEGAALLKQLLEKAGNDLDIQERFFAASQAYLGFARLKPALYTLMMNRLGPSTAGPGKDVWNVVLTLMSEVTYKPDDTAAAVAFWSFLHGFTVLENSGMFGKSGPKGGLEVGLKALFKGLATT
jgi:AcrR family transcriptional regulator